MRGNRSTLPTPPLDPAFAGELLGSPIVLEHPGLAQRRVEGVLIDETLGTFLVRVPGEPSPVRVPKAGARGEVLLGGRTLPLSGDALRVRPEDRTKRLASRGRRS
ncbi:MAG TPA: hypothetical protein VGV64_07485 [Thermoplasmata archaeon]|nr:hypothetical protein [Thermoplasmata archaeon]